MARATSAQAYDHLVESGRLAARHAEVYATVYEHGPLTANEAWEIIRSKRGGLRYDSNTRARFTELRDMGLLQECGTRACTITGRACLVWDVTDQVVPSDRPARKRPGNRIAELEAEVATLRAELASLRGPAPTAARPSRPAPSIVGQLPFNWEDVPV